MAKKRSLIAPESVSLEQFVSLEEHGHRLPQLFLGLSVPKSVFRDSGFYARPNFKDDRRWLNVVHGGYAVGTVLTLRNTVLVAGMTQLAQQWVNHNCRTLDAVNAYRTQIRGLFASDCNDCFRELRPGYYPIDIGYVSFLAKDALPSNLDDLIDWDDGIQRAAYGGRWQLGIIGPISSRE